MKKSIVGCLIFLLASAFLVSCGNKIEGYSFVENTYKNDNPSAEVVILGNHANAMAVPQDAYNSMEEMFSSAVYGGYVCAVVADATPTKVDIEVGDNFFAEDAKNPTTLKERLATRSKELTENLKNAGLKADSAEVDLLAAIREASNVLANSKFKDLSDKRIIIVDTGISTAGELNFLDIDFLTASPEISDIITQLKEYEGTGVLPDLSGITVTFIGTGDGLAEPAEPQRLSITDKKYVRDLWKEVVLACGAEDVLFESAAGWDTPNIYTEDAESEFPYVSTVAFSHDKVINLPDPDLYKSNDPDSWPPLPEPPVFEIELSSQMIGFRPDSSALQNEQSASNILKPFAEELENFFELYPDKKAWVVGTTATIYKNGDGSVELSIERAEIVKRKLVEEFGIPEDRLVTIGLGARFPWAVDAWVNGSFDTVVAQENRAVWILSDNSERFMDIQTAYDNEELLMETMIRLDSLD